VRAELADQAPHSRPPTRTHAELSALHVSMLMRWPADSLVALKPVMTPRR
jgi:hypothetical protein